VVGEHSKCVEAGSARACGALGRENVGMSNHNAGVNPAPRKSKVSSAMEFSGGLGGPKAMAKAAVDGQQVNIPARLLYAMEGRGAVCRASEWLGVLY
jgi:hypothetical protein